MRRRMAVLCLACLLLTAAGCRLPRPYFASTYFQQRAEHFEYDTRHPEALPPERAHYAQALAEPVTLVGWEEEVESNWRILFATNRGWYSDGDRAHFNNEVKPHPLYGACLVTLPHRERGLDAPPEPDNRAPEWLQAVMGRAEHDVEEKVQQLQSTVDAVQPLGNPQFFDHLNSLIEASPQRDVLLFVHGFNVTFDDAVKRAAQLAADLPFNGAVVVYSWPTQGGLNKYERDGEVVDESLPAFKEFLLEFARRVPADARTNVVVHSMGNRLVQRALWHLPDEYAQPPRFTEMVFCAPDVGVEEFRRNVRQATKVSRRVTLYQCTNDSALLASMFKNGEERAGSPNAPVLAEGMDTIETGPVDVSLLGHSYYGSNPTVLRDLFAVVKEHAPAQDRKWLKSHKMPFQSVPLWILSEHPEQLVWTWHFEENQGAGPRSPPGR